MALKEIRLEHEEGAPCTAIREGTNIREDALQASWALLLLHAHTRTHTLIVRSDPRGSGIPPDTRGFLRKYPLPVYLGNNQRNQESVPVWAKEADELESKMPDLVLRASLKVLDSLLGTTVRVRTSHALNSNYVETEYANSVSREAAGLCTEDWSKAPFQKPKTGCENVVSHKPGAAIPGSFVLLISTSGT